MSNHKGKRSRWFPRTTPPARPGPYECGVKLTNGARVLILWVLEWDGRGFRVPCPMVVVKWRGLAHAPRGREG